MHASKLLFICVCLKKKLWNIQKYKQPWHLICHQVVQIQQKHLKFLLPCYFWRMPKKVLYYSFTPWRKCVTVFSFLYVHKLFSNKKKVWFFLSIVMRIETLLLANIIPYQCFFYFPILIIHIQKLRYNSVYIFSHGKSESKSKSHCFTLSPQRLQVAAMSCFRSFDFDGVFFTPYLLSLCSL